MFSSSILGYIFYKLKFPRKIPLKEYTKTCLYLAVMDDEIARNRFENKKINGKLVNFPSKRESLQYRYHLHLEMHKNLSAELLDKEVRTYEKLLEESKQEKYNKDNFIL